DRFPENAVARTGQAEVLRDLGRFSEALAAYDAAIDRFPENAVARNGRANLLGSVGELDQVVEMLSDVASSPKRRSDWVAVHILGMAYLQVGDLDKADEMLSLGLTSCPFLDQRSYFSSAYAVLSLTMDKAPEAENQLSELANAKNIPQAMKRNVILLHAHALASCGRVERAREALNNPQIVDFATERQKRLARSIDDRFGLEGISNNSTEENGILDEKILSLEVQLIGAPNFGVSRPKSFAV
uniref:tetratricopeptide repeat protein n=1 Tax=uncultured Pelagimonas sp. TaxID=1618102 RepID=UPI002626B528